MSSTGLKTLLSQVLPNFPVVSPDTEVEVMQELPVETLYLALKNTDSETTLWFFQNAVPEQAQGLIDIDCWEGSEFLPERFEPYFKAIALCSPPKIAEYMKRLDPEVIVRSLMEYIEVRDYDPQNPPLDVPEQNLMLTLDNKYALVLKSENPEIREMLYLWMNKFSAADIELLRRHLESCKWEVASDLEEFGYQIKKGRIEDMGFVDYYEAIALYSRGKASTLKKELLDKPLAPDAKYPPEFTPNEDTSSVMNPEFLPEAISQPLFGEGFLKESLKGITDTRRKSIVLMEILRTMNASLAADKTLFEDLEKIAIHTRRARSYVELGLLYLADGNTSKGTSLLETQPVGQLYRLGWLAVQDIVTVASELSARTPPRLFGELDADLLTSLKGRHPSLSDALRKDLQIKEETILSIEALIRIGARLTTLTVLDRYFGKDLENALVIGKHPLGTNESAYSRLLTGLFRQACQRAGADVAFDARPLTSPEWETLAVGFNETEMRKLSELVASRCPDNAREHFKERLLALVDDLVFYMRSNGAKKPDHRFFKALSFA